MERNKLITMIEIAIMAGLSFILSKVEFGALWAFGGSISLIMVPIFVMAFRRGWQAGLVTGLLAGIISLLTGGYVVHPVQLVLDYPLAYAVLGIGGLAVFHKPITTGRIFTGLLLGTSLRLVCHFMSGIIWFGSAAPKEMPVAVYSFLYNISYLLPEMLITAAVLVFLKKTAPSFYKQSASIGSSSASY
ncbi:energy-coupled thiamine transporter ThiT [Pseudobacillus badius]|uniref:energy-coupled thiamine transporter ThiT n=1 Tax=Bacillus badius TaxID=1455 RepID=UPI0007B0774A|nr:energy-coupled thiamine transporter ThiT [Bacillus badius]KZN99689.1 energy-coupled thiamine transporter ThiT [Bacillus badius]MED0665778.1 energy-coupled thiamine transporter ThiT [Bacillus badius]OCS85794.1 energy-coupled thiamine transporter ThiT [Bacillus badius]OVE51848.1 energy-coupled thiamine transporter ThiT [Bacillus badius]TDW03276.1 thiamine transporter [Bacillus badius]